RRPEAVLLLVVDQNEKTAIFVVERIDAHHFSRPSTQAVRNHARLYWRPTGSVRGFAKIPACELFRSQRQALTTTSRLLGSRPLAVAPRQPEAWARLGQTTSTPPMMPSVPRCTPPARLYLCGRIEGKLHQTPKNNVHDAICPLPGGVGNITTGFNSRGPHRAR